MQTPPRPAIPASIPPPDLVGRDFGTRYQIQSRLGEGGIGVVYRALDRQTNNVVALKVLRESFAHTRLQRRFAREAKALAALRHPNIVSILDVDVADGTPFLVMELLEGKTLGDLLSETRPLPIDRACDIMRQLLAAVAYVHGEGLVHRDLKPGNIFLQSLPDGATQVKVLDFGLAKFLEGDAATDQTSVTRSGDIFGTPGYMPPEQAVGDTTDARADVYSAAVVCFEMLAGRRPFIGEGTDLIQQQLTRDPPSLIDACAERVASPELEAFFQRALASKASDRFADGKELRDAFEGIPQPRVRAPTLEELSELATRPAAATPQTPLQIGLAPTVFHDSADRLRTLAKSGPVARFIQSVKDLGHGILLAGAWVLSAVVMFLVMVAVAVLYILFGSGHEQQQQALRTAMPSTIRNVLPETKLDASPPNTRKGSTARAGTVIGAPTPNAPTLTAPTTIDTAGIDTAGAAEDSIVTQTPANVDTGPTIEPTAAPRPPAENPWRGSIPATLKKLRAHAQKGWRGDEHAIGWLRRYNREQQQDPRGHLVLAVIFMNRAWYSDVAAQYAFAYQRMPSSRGDQTMLRNLIKIAGLEPTFERAAGLLVGIYGAEAIKPLERAIMDTKDPALRARLEAVRVRIGD